MNLSISAFIMVMLVTFFSPSEASADNVHKQQQGQQIYMPFIQEQAEGLFIDVPLDSSFMVMIVRVFDLDNKIVFEARSRGDGLSLFADSLGDGVYHYQVKSLFQSEVDTGEGADRESELVDLKSGDFRVESNQIIPIDDAKVTQNSTYSKRGERFYKLLGMVVNTIVAPVFASHNEVIAHGILPSLFLDDTLGSGFDGFDWRVSSSFNGEFAITDELNNVVPFSIDSALTGVDTHQAIRVYYWGDVSIQGLTLFKSTDGAKLDGSLSIGSGLSPADLNIYASLPDIRLHNETSTAEIEFELNSATLKLWARPTDSSAWTYPFQVDTNAANNSLRIRADGDIQMGAGFYFNHIVSDPTLHIGSNTPSPYSLKISTINTPEMFLQNVGSSGVQMNMLSTEFSIDMDTDGDGTKNTSNVLTIHKDAPAHSLKVLNTGDLSLASSFYFKKDNNDPGLHIGDSTTTPYSLEISTPNTPEIFLKNTGSSGVQMNMLTNEFTLDMDTDGDGVRDTQNVLTIHKDAPAHSLKIQNDGDVTLANSALFVSNATKRMALGTSSTPGVFTIYDDTPNILMRDNTDTSAMTLELNNSTVALKGRPSGGVIYKSIFSYSVEAPAKSVEILANGDLQFANSSLFLEAASGELALGTTQTPGDFTIFADTPNIWWHDEVDTAEVRLELANAYMHFQSRALSGNAFKDVMSYHTHAPADSLNIDILGNVQLGASFYLKQGIADPSLHIGGNTPSPYTLQLSSGNAAGLMLKQKNTGGALLEGWSGGLSLSMDTNGDGTIETPKVMTVSLMAPASSLVINSAGQLGLGVINPSEAMVIQRVDAGARMLLSGISSAGNEAPQMIWKRARSLNGSPQAILANDNLGAFSFRGYTGSGYSGSRGFINVQATEDWTPTANGTRMLFQTTPNGSFSPVAVMEITQDGKVKISGTELNVPDYVFESDYKLMSLDQLAVFIEENKHLPGVASASEVNSEGLDLAGSQLSVLEKVEELTLYTLQQHEELKQIANLKAENQQLKASQKELLSAYHQLKAEQVEMFQMVRQLQDQRQGSIELTGLK